MRILSVFGFIGFDTEIKMGLESAGKNVSVDILNEFDSDSFLENMKKYDLLILRESFCCRDYDIEALCNKIIGKKAVIVLDNTTDNLVNKVAALNKLGFKDILTENITVTKIINMIDAMNMKHNDVTLDADIKEDFKKPKAMLRKDSMKEKIDKSGVKTERIKNIDTEKKATETPAGNKLERKLKYFNPNESPKRKIEESKQSKSEITAEMNKTSKKNSKSITEISKDKQSVKIAGEQEKISQNYQTKEITEKPSKAEKGDDLKVKERLRLYMCAHDMQSQVALNMAFSLSKHDNDVIYVELDERNRSLIGDIKDSAGFKIIELYGQSIEASFEYFKNTNARTSLIINGKYEADKLYLSSLIDVYVEVTQNQYVIDRVKAGFDKYIKPNLLKSIVVAYFEDGLMSLKKINGSLRQKSLKIYNTRQDEYNSRAESKLYTEWHSENIKEMIESLS